MITLQMRVLALLVSVMMAMSGGGSNLLGLVEFEDDLIPLGVPGTEEGGEETPATPVPATPTPAPATPEPVVETPVPATPTPAPATPEPVVETPVPATPEPVVETPVPATPEPVVETPVPVTPEPVVETPAPATPEPVVETPAPTDEPAVETAAPSEEPAAETPAPEETPVPEVTEEPAEPTEAPAPAVNGLRVTSSAVKGESIRVTAEITGAAKIRVLVDGADYPRIDTTDKTDDEIAEAIEAAGRSVPADGKVTITLGTDDLAEGEHSVSIRLKTEDGWTSAMGHASFTLTAPAEAEATPEPATEPETTAEPVAEPTEEPAVQPESTPAPTAEPEPTAEPAVEPEATPVPTEEPATEPEATPEPAAEPEATVEPAAEEAAAEEPVAEEPAEEAVPEPTPAPETAIANDAIMIANNDTVKIEFSQPVQNCETGKTIKSVVPASSTIVGVKVNDNGTSFSITPKKVGTTKVTVTFTDKTRIVCTANVYDKTICNSVTLSVPSVIYIGTEYQAGATLLPNTAIASVTFKSSSTKLATIDAQTGAIVPLKEGTVTFTVTTSNGKKMTQKVTVADPKKAALISLEEGTAITMNLGDTLELNPMVEPATAVYTLTWTSSSAKTVAVQSGKLTALKEGTATITVTTNNSKKATLKVTVVDPYKPTGVSLAEGTAITMNLGDTLALTPVLQPETAQSALTWKTSSAKIVAVQDGKLTALKEGTVTITVTTVKSSKKATIKVTVVDPTKAKKLTILVNDEPAGTAAVTLTTARSVTLGYIAEAIGGEGFTVPASSLTWSSSSSSIAAIDAKTGVVTPKKAGTVTFTLKSANGVKATAKVTFVAVPKITSIKLNDLMIPNVGDVVAIQPVIAPASAAEYAELTWTIADESIATVDASGNVTAISRGLTTLTVKDGVTGKTATCQINVGNVIESLALNKTSAELLPGDTLQLVATAKPGSAVPDLTWTTGNADVATVDANGLVTAHSNGVAVIWANEETNGLSVSCTVVVSNSGTYRALVVVEPTDFNVMIEGESYRGYTSRIADLDGMCAMLSRQDYNGSRWNITRMHGTSASAVLAKLKSLASVANEHDVTMFAFMGHGGSKGSIHFYDGSYISAATLKKYLDAIPGKVVVLLGCCYGGSYIAKGESTGSFNSSVMSVFAVGDTIPVTYKDGSEVTAVTGEMLSENVNSVDGTAYTGRSGELRAEKYYVLTAAAATEYSWSTLMIDDYDEDTLTCVVEEDECYTDFFRGVCRAGGYDAWSGKNTWTSGTRTLNSVYSSTYSYCKYENNGSSSVQVYPANSSFVLFSR